MGIPALLASLIGAAVFGFAALPLPFLAAWAIIWGLAFLWSHRASMAAAIADHKLRDDPALIRLLTYSTSILGTVGMFLVVHVGVFYLAQTIAIIA